MAATTDTDFLTRVRSALDEDLSQTTARIAGLEHALSDYAAVARRAASDDEHDDDASAMAFDRARTAGLLEAAHEHLDEVASALARIEGGTFGVCENCGAAITPERLEARPVARLCIRCAAAHEHH